jgi:hypothetical protein
MDDAVRPPLADRHLQRVEHQFGPQMVGHGPADDLAAPGIQNHCEIEKTARRRHEGDVGNPELVRPESSEIAVDQVGCRSGFLVPPCGNDRAAPAAGTNQPGGAHQPGNAFTPMPLPSCPELGMHPRRAIGLA